MEKEIQIFNNPSFGAIRVTELNGEPMFCLADVCSAVKLTNPSNVKSRLDNEDTQLIDLHALSGDDNVIIGNSMATFINETAFYDVLLFSSSDNVKPFRHWVTHEVLPSIRKHGAYLSNEAIEKTLTDPDYLIKLATTLKEERIKRIEAECKVVALQTSNDAMKPKAEFADAVMGSSDAIDMRKAATTLNMGIGRNKLFELLREKGVLDRHNIPYQTYIDRGYFRTIESTYNKPDGSSCINIKTVIFQKGLDFIRKLLNAA